MNGQIQKIVPKRAVFSSHGKRKGRNTIAMLTDKMRREEAELRSAFKPTMYGSVIEAVRAESKRIGKR